MAHSLRMLPALLAAAAASSSPRHEHDDDGTSTVHRSMTSLAGTGASTQHDAKRASNTGPRLFPFLDEDGFAVVVAAGQAQSDAKAVAQVAEATQALKAKLRYEAHAEAQLRQKMASLKHAKAKCDAKAKVAELKWCRRRPCQAWCKTLRDQTWTTKCSWDQTCCGCGECESNGGACAAMHRRVRIHRRCMASSGSTTENEITISAACTDLVKASGSASSARIRNATKGSTLQLPKRIAARVSQKRGGHGGDRDQLRDPPPHSNDSAMSSVMSTAWGARGVKRGGNHSGPSFGTGAMSEARAQRMYRLLANHSVASNGKDRVSKARGARAGLNGYGGREHGTREHGSREHGSREHVTRGRGGKGRGGGRGHGGRGDGGRGHGGRGHGGRGAGSRGAEGQGAGSRGTEGSGGDDAAAAATAGMVGYGNGYGNRYGVMLVMIVALVLVLVGRRRMTSRTPQRPSAR